MSRSVRVFVGLVFTLLGLSFLATTGVLVWEFWDTEWATIASFYSHLFLFFPTFGIVTLFAFYTPACVFTDMYMRHVPYGLPRFGFGLIMTVAISVAGAYVLTGSNERSVFEVAPAELRADAGQPGRLPILVAVDNVRRVSQTRIGLADLARNCRPDTLKDVPAHAEQVNRYCFASTPLPRDIATLGRESRISDVACCQAQERFALAVKELHNRENGRSLTALAHTALLPFKLFFALVLFTISIMLAVRRAAMETHYGEFMPGIERGVLIGAVAMVVFPIMSHAFLQSAALLYQGGGPSGGYRSIAPAFSFALGAWGLLLLFFFYGRQNERVQNLARIGGMIGSAVAVVKYDQIIDVSVRGFGSGAGLPNLALLCIAALAALLLLSSWSTREGDDDEGAPTVAGKPSKPQQTTAPAPESAKEADADKRPARTVPMVLRPTPPAPPPEALPRSTSDADK